MRVIDRSGPPWERAVQLFDWLVHQSIVPCALPGPDYRPRRPRPQLPIAPEDHWLLGPGERPRRATCSASNSPSSRGLASEWASLRFFGAGPVSVVLISSEAIGRFVAAYRAATWTCRLKSEIVWSSSVSRTVRFHVLETSRKLRVRLRLRITRVFSSRLLLYCLISHVPGRCCFQSDTLRSCSSGAWYSSLKSPRSALLSHSRQ